MTPERSADRLLADHGRAIAVFAAVLGRVRPTDLPLATPCAGWQVRDLLAHQLGQDLAFAAALRGGASALTDWASVPVGQDVPAPLLAALDDQEHAQREFVASGRRAIWMPEILPDRPLPADRAVGAHLIDLLIHAWDLGVAIGSQPAIDLDLADFCLAVARSIPDTPERRGPGSAFIRALPGDVDDPAFDQALRLLGRDPGWVPPKARATL